VVNRAIFISERIINLFLEDDFRGIDYYSLAGGGGGPRYV